MSVRCILTDIEGTTTSIHFVHEVLFPYAAAHLGAWLSAHGGEARVREVLADVKATVLEEEGVALDDAGAEAVLHAWIRADRKHPALKRIQGWIWKEGYAEGAYTSHVYADVRPALARWEGQGLRLAVYSSGSVEAQQLLFGYTSEGDLRGYFSGWYDTGVGHKRDAQSYRNIAGALGLDAGEVLFLSDVPEELDAAEAAGMQVCHLLRPGTAAVDRYAGVPDFSAIMVS